MNKKYWIAVCMKDCGKQWAFVLEWHGRLNLAHNDIFEDSRTLSANICDSKSEAQRIVNGWNDEFIQGGVYPF